MNGMLASRPLIDGLGRRITYLRVSVTDRCDLRCTYCMPERAAFAPKGNLLDFDELDRLCTLFVARGVRKLRITGGEPLIRRGVIDFIRGLGRHLRSGALDELTLTTNGTQLAPNADALAHAGVKRINVSLDTLDRSTFTRICRRDRLPDVFDGISAARAAGLSVKINTVALRRDNAAEIPAIIRWAHANGMDLTLIETMPLGDIDEDRTDQFLPLTQVRRELERVWTLDDEARTTGGPARYARVRETGGSIGFITPITNVFCATCNRVRLTCTGQLFLCLGRDEKIDFREALRAGSAHADLEAMLDDCINRKPAAHDFRIVARGAPAVERHMSVTGG
jgi:cyclic pyranopterin phosphate synthase